MRVKIILFVASFCFAFQHVNAQTYSAENAHAEVDGSFALGSYKGVSDQLAGTIDVDKQTVSFQIPLNSISTGISKRDEHMLEALEASEYPYAKFEGEFEGFDINKSEKQEVKLSGTFTIHGKQKALEIPGTLEKTNEGLYFFAAFSIYITEFEIERPSVMFIKINDQHDIEVNGLATKEGEM